MKTKLDNIYTEISKEYKKDDNFDINEYQNQIDAEIRGIDRDIEINKGIKRSQKAHADRLLENISKENNQEKKNNITQQVLDINKKIVELNKEEQQLVEKKQQLKMKKQNYLGYSKNRIEIEKIKDYKIKLEEKAKSIKNKLEAAESRCEFLKDGLEKEKKDFEDAEKKLNDAKKEAEKVFSLNVNADATEQKAFYNSIEDKQATIKIAETLYNGAKKSFEQKQKEIDDWKSKVEKYKAEYKTLSGMIGKCDLAWKTLFTNKGWDEIHRRSLENGKKYTRNNPEKEVKKENKEPEKTVEEPAEKTVEEPAEKTTVEPTPLNNTNTQEKALTEVKPAGFFSRIAARLRNAYNNVRSYFRGEYIVSDEEVEKIEAAKKEKIIAERKEIERQRQEEIERIKAQREAANSKQKDSFIEALRIKVDDEYAKEYNTKKENEYKSKKQNEQQANKEKNVKQLEVEKDEER